MKLGVIADSIQAVVASSEREYEIDGIQEPEEAGCNSITFMSSVKYRDSIAESDAGAVIVKKGTEPFSDKINLFVEDPYLGYALTAQLFEDTSPVWGEGVSESAVIDTTSEVMEGVSIGPGSVIGPGCIIQENTEIGAGVIIESGCSIGTGSRIDNGAVLRRNCVIGERVIIQSNAVIGSEGFGNAQEEGHFVRIPCFGNVVIEDEAEIGAGVTIDRGNFRATRIGKGSKIDNLVQIAHNVEVGEHCAMAAQTGISGSTSIEDGAILAGQVGVAGHLRIGRNAFVGAKAGISKSVESGGKVTGYPARDIMKMRRIEAAQMKLPELLKKVRRMEKKLEELT